MYIYIYIVVNVCVTFGWASESIHRAVIPACNDI